MEDEEEEDDNEKDEKDEKDEEDEDDEDEDEDEEDEEGSDSPSIEEMKALKSIKYRLVRHRDEYNTVVGKAMVLARWSAKKKKQQKEKDIAALWKSWQQKEFSSEEFQLYFAVSKLCLVTRRTASREPSQHASLLLI